MSTATHSLVPTIGIEIHVQFNTVSKLFAAVDNDAVDQDPNTLVSPVCFGLPGSLPVLNEAAIEKAVKAGIALNAVVNKTSKFDRKHYFYPDLPLGYQITQLYEKIIGEGSVQVEVDGEQKTIRIESAHIEADAGKSSHDGQYSNVDLNRAGTPLLEIVSMPDIKSPAQAREYVKELYLLMKYAGVSNVDLFRGNMRFDVNVSVAPEDAKELGMRTEIKNLNSFKAVEKAAEYEIRRQIEIVEAGGEISQETRGWDDDKLETFSQRSKEDAHDYRYFPEPDVPPIVISDDFIQKIRESMPVLPAAIRDELSTRGVNNATIEALLQHTQLAHLVMEVVDIGDASLVKKSCNWIVTDLLAEVREDFDWKTFNLSAKDLKDLKTMIDDGSLSSTGAKQVLMLLYQSTKSPADIADEHNLIQVSDTGEIEAIVEQVIRDNPKATADIKAGNEGAIGFLVGQVMKLSQGKANPALAKDIIKGKLDI